MASPLQKSPLGLLQAFNLQTLGEAPRFFGETVVPVSNAEVFYLRENVEQIGTVTQWSTGQSASAQLTVAAPDAAWYLYAVSCLHIPPSADAALEVTLATRLTLNAGGAVILSHGTFLPGVNAMTNGSGQQLEFWFPQPFLLRPADSITALIATSATATMQHSLGLQVCAARLRAAA